LRKRIDEGVSAIEKGIARGYYLPRPKRPRPGSTSVPKHINPNDVHTVFVGIQDEGTLLANPSTQRGIISAVSELPNNIKVILVPIRGLSAALRLLKR
jgi:hypothetical protein